MLQANYTNPQGDNFSKAIIQATFGSRNTQFNQSARLRPDGESHDYNESSSDTVNFTAQYWADQARFEAGQQPYKFTNEVGQENFTFQMTPELVAVYDDAVVTGMPKEEALETLVEQYMIDNLLEGGVKILIGEEPPV